MTSPIPPNSTHSAHRHRAEGGRPSGNKRNNSGSNTTGSSALSPITAKASRSGRSDPVINDHATRARPAASQTHAIPIATNSQPARFFGWRATIRLPVESHTSATTSPMMLPTLTPVVRPAVPSAISCWMEARTAGPSAMFGSPTTSGAVTGCLVAASVAAKLATANTTARAMIDRESTFAARGLIGYPSHRSVRAFGRGPRPWCPPPAR